MSEAAKNEVAPASSGSFKPKKSVALSGVVAGNTALCTVGRSGNDLHYRGYNILDGADRCDRGATRAGDRVSLLACDSAVRADVRRPAPEDVLPSFVNALANVEAELVQTDFRVVVSQVLERLGQRSLVVLLTGLDPALRLTAVRDAPSLPAALDDFAIRVA